MTTPAHRLPIHRECHHGHHTTTAPDDCQQALETLTDVWAALNRAGATGHATAAELIDQLAGDRDQARAALADVQELIATLDHVAEQLDRARARYTTRPGSPSGSAHDVGTLIRYCVYPGCPRTYRADVGPQDQGWIRLRGLTVLCPDHSTYATGRTQDTAPPAESHTRSPGDPGAGVGVGGALLTAHSGSQPATRWRNDQ